MGWNKQKLKTNLRLSINRLKLLEKKKTELAQKARKEIADYLTNGKDERARIRVEHIIREDYLVEAMELIELYCDLCLARFGLIETQAVCDEGMVEAVSTLIWVAPRLQTDVQELKVIGDQFGLKYGKPFAHEASTNANGTVNERLILKMSPQPPPKILVERYLIEIARSHSVQFEPDPSVMLSEDIPDVDDFSFNKGGGSGGVGGSGGGGGGADVRSFGFEKFEQGGPGSAVNSLPSIPAMSGPNPGYAYPPPVGGVQMPYPTGPPAHSNSMPSSQGPPYPMEKKGVVPPPAGPSQNPPYPMDNKVPPPGYSPAAPPTNPQGPSAPPSGPSIPDLPTVPANSLPVNPPGSTSAGGEDVDFDDLTRRFEDLKKKK